MRARPKANLVQVLSVQIANRGMGAADRRFARMKDQINEVMTLQRSDAPAIHACSFAYLWPGEQRLALQLARRAYSLAQVIATKGNLASCLVMNGLAKEAWQEIAELDSWYPPLAAKPHTAVFRDYYMLTEEWENALEWAERVHGGGPEFLNRMIEAIILAELDRIDAAKTKIDQVRSIFPRLNLRKSVASRALTCNNIPQFYHGLEILIDHGIE